MVLLMLIWLEYRVSPGGCQVRGWGHCESGAEEERGRDLISAGSLKSWGHRRALFSRIPGGKAGIPTMCGNGWWMTAGRGAAKHSVI